MSAKPTKIPRWAATAPGTITGTIVEPSEDKKTAAFVVRERIPSQFLDWLFYIIYTWIQYLSDGALVGNHSIDGSLTVGGLPLTFVDFTFTADNTTDQIAHTAHGLATGDGPVRVSNSGGGLPAGLAAGTDYYFIKIDSDHGQLATSRARALVGTAIDITTNGTGTQTLLHQAGTTRVTDASVTRDLTVGGSVTAASFVRASWTLTIFPTIVDWGGNAFDAPAWHVDGSTILGSVGYVSNAGADGVKAGIAVIPLNSGDRVTKIRYWACGNGTADATATLRIGADFISAAEGATSLDSVTDTNRADAWNQVTLTISGANITAQAGNAWAVIAWIPNAAGYRVGAVEVTLTHPAAS